MTAAAAASILFGGVASDAAPIPDTVTARQQEKYGGPRDWSQRAYEQAWVWKRLVEDWRAPLGLSGVGESWASRKVGASVTYSVDKDGDGLSVTYRLTKRTDKEVMIQSLLETDRPVERAVARKPAAPAGTKEGTETREVDGKRFECEIRSFTQGGRTTKVWFSKDAPFGWTKAVSGDETTMLVKLSEAVVVGDKTYDCSQWQTVNGDVVIHEWRSKDVPGLTVKWEETLKNPKDPARPTSVLKIKLTGVVEGK